MSLRPWSAIPIRECDEPLQALPASLLRLEPHPYALLGAPYGDAGSPFQLRQGVIKRLLQAQQHVQAINAGWRLAIFDAWRPLAVQRFMVEHTIEATCRQRGVDPKQASAARDAVMAEVGRFWAPPSDDPATPPPHSTGAAVDLTLAVADAPLDMGSPIDALGAVSEPDYFQAQASGRADCSERRQALEWHRRRTVLREAMQRAGFAQHPNEWWHFSWGDQLWAWRSGQSSAHYGRC